MKTLLELFEYRNLTSLKIICSDNILYSYGENFSTEKEVSFCGGIVGKVVSNLDKHDHNELSEQLATLLYLYQMGYDWDTLVNLQAWVREAKLLVSEVTDWIGIYYKANYFLHEESTDLVLGPYYGDSTTHTRIPLDRGLCGLALREERVVNVADVHQDSRHIACSLKTNSELIIPLTNSEGKMVAELDIDCNRLGAFSPEIEETFKKYCQSFSKNWERK